MDARRGTSTQREYGAEHRAWRKQVLAKSNGLCVACLARGRTTRGRVADHIIPRSIGGAQYELDNGQALCDGQTGDGCHDIKRAAEARGRQMRVIEGRGLVDVGPLQRCA
jgi:hypothetical protein